MEIVEPLRRSLRCLFNWRSKRQDLIHEFKKCCQLVAIKRAGGELHDDDFWNLYGYFKQTVVGDFNVDLADESSEINKRKWASWKRHAGMSKREAMAAYVAIVRQLFGYDDDNMVYPVSNAPSKPLGSLMDHHDDEDDGLYSLVVNGDVERIESLLKDTPELVNVRTPSGITPLHVAADRGHIDVVMCLLKYGADMNVVDDNGDTPLLTAAAAGNRDIVDLLLRGGADQSLRNVENKNCDDILKPQKA
ncbi:Ankyrin repeats (3 copies) family protein [Babesia bovis T2Bo]|uniref:Ankyrin repeat containing protein n=1 Tax=Babesia bovis TaxID=5865 RepID=A7ASB5_BABBO|nr:Ankyrin repeats (3 copies) family protein [Babesia bovis T2Bo]EDO07434.1 Ankyrin repeats (3 copies) family protein [Babesia bovis T2Bo]|eukprot:XP_001611002.1 ankyrin repeat containing protein [Babesia bovis T2Bo]